jgi:hypothetical protein
MRGRTPSEAAASADLGLPGARKSGHTLAYPYVALLLRTDDVGKKRSEVIKGLAFPTREDAVAHARLHIERERRSLQERLSLPRYRLLREQYGVTEDGL